MHGLAQLCVRRPVFTTMLILALIVVGAFSYFSLGVDLFPKVDIPAVSVIVSDPGASPEEVETEITKMHLKSVIARVRKTGGALQVLGFVLNDGTPLKSVEVQIDNGQWQQATLDPSNTKYSWKLFTYRWDGATPGEHTLVSRAIDANGAVQPTAAELKRKKTFLQDNSQFPRKVMVS